VAAVGTPLSFKANLSIRGSQVSVVVQSENVNNDLASLRNYVRQCVRSAVDMLNYIWGQGFDVQLTSVVNLNGEHIVFNVEIPELSTAQAERPLTVEQLWKLVCESQYLRRALGDLRESVQQSEDTGFFCFRAVESIRQYFWQEKDGENKKPSWERLRNELRIDKSWIDALKPFADKQRHGSTDFMSAQDRTSAMQHAWKVVDRFCVYLYRGSVTLPENEFELLTDTKTDNSSRTVSFTQQAKKLRGCLKNIQPDRVLSEELIQERREEVERE